MLTSNDYEIITHLGYPKKVNLSIGSYYIKRITKKALIRELLGFKLASLFNLIAPEYKVLKIDNYYYLLSVDLNQIGAFKTAKEIGITDFINNSIYQVNLYLKLNNMLTKTLKDEIISLYLYDMLFVNFDRHNCNWGFINIAHENHLAILDNETIFDTDYLSTTNYFKHFEGLTSYKGYVKITIEDIREFIQENLIYFLTNYPEYTDLLNNLLSKLTPQYLLKLIKEIEQDTTIKIDDAKTLIEIYNANYNLIKDLEREYNHAR